MGQRDKPQRQTKRVARTRAAAESTTTSLVHPKFGTIPLLPRSYQYEGLTRTYYAWDPNYKPPLPRGAVAGNISKQIYCCDTPLYFYEDQIQKCTDCNITFVFSAREQKYWYETLQFRDLVAVRCRPCRKRRRSAKSLNEALSVAHQRTQSAPMDARSWQALGEALLRLYRATQQGNLRTAVAAFRKVRKLEPRFVESLFFEAQCHALLGQQQRLRVCVSSLLHPESSATQKVRAAAQDLLAVTLANASGAANSGR